jgi:hypothetical protein
MRINRHKWQIVLFIAAILVPAAVLIGLSTQLMQHFWKSDLCQQSPQLSSILAPNIRTQVKSRILRDVVST